MTETRQSTVRKEEVGKFYQITTDRMYTALESYHTWKALAKMKNVNEVGKEKAERNVEILKKYWDFFHSVETSSYKSFIIDLAIFFDKERYEDTFSLNKLLSVARNMITEAEYSDLLEKIRIIKAKNGTQISLVLELRNTDVGHQKIERKEHFIKFTEVEALFEAVQEILNLVSKHTSDSHTSWDHVGRGAAGSLVWVIDNLERGEKVRLDEIHKMYS